MLSRPIFVLTLIALAALYLFTHQAAAIASVERIANLQNVTVVPLNRNHAENAAPEEIQKVETTPLEVKESAERESSEPEDIHADYVVLDARDNSSLSEGPSPAVSNGLTGSTDTAVSETTGGSASNTNTVAATDSSSNLGLSDPSSSLSSNTNGTPGVSPTVPTSPSSSSSTSTSSSTETASATSLLTSSSAPNTNVAPLSLSSSTPSEPTASNESSSTSSAEVSEQTSSSLPVSATSSGSSSSSSPQSSSSSTSASSSSTRLGNSSSSSLAAASEVLTTFNSVTNGQTIVVTQTSIMTISSSQPSASSDTSNSNSSGGLSDTNKIIVGVVVGVGGAILLAIAALVFWMRKHGSNFKESGWTFWRKNEKGGDDSFFSGELGVRDRNINQGSNF